jgi:Bacterial Ig-like domain (group 1)
VDSERPSHESQPRKEAIQLKAGRSLTLLLLLAVWLGTAGAAAAVDSFDPAVVEVTLAAGESTTIDKTLHLDELPGAADIILAVDTTGSMCDAIAQAQAEATQIVTEVQNEIPGARFAVVDFRDYPFDPYGDPGDSPYSLLTAGFTADAAVVNAAIGTMVCGGGNDTPESYNRVFFEAYSDPVLSASRNPEAVQFLVVLGDAPPHDPTQTVAPACGDQPPVDPGRDAVPGNADDLETEDTIAGLNSNEITLLMIAYLGILPCYEELAAAGGGDAVAGGAAEDLSQQIVEAILAEARQIDEVLLEVSGVGCQTPAGLNITFSPPNPPPYGPFTAPVDIVFQETITAPTLPGSYSCVVTAIVDGTPRARQLVNATVTPGPPATLVLEPESDENIVDEEHCVIATVEDAFGNPTPGITVRFSVSGASSASGSAITDAAGQATFCYTGPPLPGVDVITAFADTDGDGVLDPGEPSDRALKRWVIPPSEEGCKVTGGGRITAANGDKATFGGNAKGSGPSGNEEYQDHGPAMDINVHSIEIQSVVCSADGTMASIFGTATINGSGSFDFRIDVQDLGEPGQNDRYRIRLSNGYDSGDQQLRSGNIQIHL